MAPEKRSRSFELFDRDTNPETGHCEWIFRFRFSRSETPFHAACTFGKNPELAAQILDRGAVSINIQGWKPPGWCWSGPGLGGRGPSSASYTASNLKFDQNELSGFGLVIIIQHRRGRFAARLHFFSSFSYSSKTFTQLKRSKGVSVRKI